MEVQRWLEMITLGGTQSKQMGTPSSHIGIFTNSRED